MPATAMSAERMHRPALGTSVAQPGATAAGADDTAQTATGAPPARASNRLAAVASGV